MTRRRFAFDLWLRLSAGGVLGLHVAAVPAAPGDAGAASGYPSRPVRLIVPFPSGGGASDVSARIIAEKLSQRFRQQVIVDNRPGAGGNIAGVLAARAPADGHTLYLITTSTAVNAALYDNLGYDPVHDFSPIVHVMSLPYTLVVNAAYPAKSVKEFLALARAKPGSVSHGSNGFGGLGHVSGELLASLTGTRFLHVPYKGGVQAMTDMMAGQITFVFATPLLSTPHARSGRVRILAVTTKTRSSALPDVPTLNEAGAPGYEVASWNGLLAPRATPAAIIAKVNAETMAGVSEVRERLAQDGSELAGGSPADFAALIRADIAKWAKLARDIGLKVQ